MMVISNFQLGSVIDHPSENPCVGGSIPSLATNRIKKLRAAFALPFFFVNPTANLFRFSLCSGPDVFGGLDTVGEFLKQRTYAFYPIEFKELTRLRLNSPTVSGC